MRATNFRKFISALAFLVILIPGLLKAEDLRSIPLDLYLIVDASEGFQRTREEAVAWINDEVIDRLLQEGDRLVIWSAGETARIMHSETIGSEKNEAKQKLENLEILGRSADISTAIREAVLRSQRDTGPDRISFTLMVGGSAGILAPALRGNTAGLFRWSKAVKYSRWQALVLAPGIGEDVRKAAAAYMASR